MNEYQAAKLDPFAARQCFHWNSDGIRCRAFACHNQYTCFHHRCPDEPSIPIIANDPFTLPPLRTRHGIQDALDVIATLLAGKRIDDRRAKLLLYTIQLASNQLPRPTAATRPEAAIPAEVARTAAPRYPEASRYPEDSSSGLSTPAEQGVSTPGVQPAPTNKPPREYTRPERDYLSSWAIRGEPSIVFLRPASLSDQEIEAYLAYARARIDADRKADRKPRKAC